MSQIANIERRAKELAKWNPSRTLAWAHQVAQSEADAGTLPDYSPLGIAKRDIEALERDIAVAVNASRYDAAWVAELNEKLVAACAKRDALLGVEGQIAMYRDMTRQAIKTARKYLSEIGRVPTPCWTDIRHYRRCYLTLAADLRASATAPARVAA